MPAWVKDLLQINYNEDASGGGAESSVDTDGQDSTGDTGVKESDSDVSGQNDTVDKQSASRAIQAEKAKLKQKYEGQINQYRSVVDRLTKVTGLTPEQLAQRLDAFTQQQQAQQAQQSGLDPQVYQHLNGMANVLQATRAETLKLQRELEKSKLMANPTYADFADVEEDVTEYADRFGVSLEQAYWAVNGSKRAEQIAREAEQRAIANRENTRDFSVVSGDRSTGSDSAKFESEEEMLAASIFGLSAEDYKALEKADNIDKWNKYLEKKKRK